MRNVVVGIIKNGDEIFICKKRHGIYYLPGGKVKPGETDAEALARELKEELEIDVVVGEKLIELRKGSKNIILKVFNIEQYSTPIGNTEFLDTRFVSRKNLIKYRYDYDDFDMMNIIAKGIVG